MAEKVKAEPVAAVVEEIASAIDTSAVPDPNGVELNDPTLSGREAVEKNLAAAQKSAE